MSEFEPLLVYLQVLDQLELHNEVRLCSIKQDKTAVLMARCNGMSHHMNDALLFKEQRIQIEVDNYFQIHKACHLENMPTFGA